jgi:hypothetical protein
MARLAAAPSLDLPLLLTHLVGQPATHPRPPVRDAVGSFRIELDRSNHAGPVGSSESRPRLRMRRVTRTSTPTLATGTTVPDQPTIFAASVRKPSSSGVYPHSSGRTPPWG